MTRFDPELISALAEERLAPGEAEALEREIAGDPDAAAELAAQRRALAVLRGAPAVRLTEAESVLLRAAVAESLGLSSQAAPAASRARRRAPWGAIAVAAASLVAIVAIVPSIGLLNTGGDDATDTTVLAGTATEQEAATRDEAAADGGQVLQAEPTPAAAEGEALSEELAEAVPPPVATTVAADMAAAVTAVDPALQRLFDENLAPDPDPTVDSCRDQAVGVLGVETADGLSGALITLDEGGEAVVWFVEDDGGLDAAAAFSTSDCILLAVAGG